MVAILNAPDIVEFTWAQVKGNSPRQVAVDWDTGSNIKGQVTVQVSGHAPGPPIPPAGVVRGNTAFVIRLGESATVTLQSLDGRTTLGVRTVQTRMDAVAQHMTDLMFIQDLRVDVGVDTLTVTFSTPQPAVGAMKVRPIVDGKAGNPVAFPMEQHGKQQHSLSALNLAQGTDFTVEVLGLRLDGLGRVTLGDGANNPSRLVRITTGTRSVNVFFDSIHLDNDSDSGGSGETTFAFGAGGVLDQSLWGQEFFDDDDFGDGGDRDLNRVIHRDRAPSWIWAGAFGYDSDGSFWTGSLGIVGIAMSFAGPGTHGRETTDTASADVFDWFDTNQFASGRRIPITLKTGSFAFAFTVTAAIQVIRNPGVRHGVALGKGRVKDRTHLRDGAHLQVGKVLGGFGRGMSARIARPAVDTVVVASALRPTDEPNQVVEISMPAGGDPVLVGDGDDLHLFALDEGGSVLGWTLRADRAPGDPVQFGGSSNSLAAAGTTGGIRLFGVDDDHRLMTRSAADDQWSAIGDEITGTPALWVHEDWVSVVGRRDDGRVVHARLTAPDWGGAGVRWEDLGTAPDGALVVEAAVDSGVVVRSEAQDRSGALLHWPGYPDPDRRTEWFEVPAP